MFSRKLKSSSVCFDTYFNGYINRLDIYLNYLNEYLKENSKDAYRVWLTPIPINPFNVTMEETEMFQKKIDTINNITTSYTLSTFDRLDLWIRRKDLLVNSNGHFSLHGK